MSLFRRGAPQLSMIPVISGAQGYPEKKVSRPGELLSPVPSGNLTQLLKIAFIVDFPIKHGDFP